MKTAFIFKAVFHNIKHRWAAVLISVLAIAIAFTFLSTVGNITFGLASTAVNSSLNYPLVVGPEGSSDTQLVMSTIFNIDKPKGTLDYTIYEKLKKDERVTAAFPVARADSYEGIPIIGVDSAFINEINNGFVLKQKELDTKDTLSENDLHRAVLGFKIAEKYGLKLGDEFIGSHGHVGDADAHSHAKFKYYVAAVMKPVHGPEDFSIYINFKAVWKIHEHFHDHDAAHEEHNEPDEHAKIAGESAHHDHETGEHGEHHEMNGESEHHDHDAVNEEHHEHLTPGKLSAVLVKTTNPVATSQLEREYSAGIGSTAADVAKTVRRIVQYMNKAEQAAGFFSYITLLLVLAMVFVTILMSINERKKEMALMRTLGIGRMSISMTVMLETMFVTLAGIAAGLIFGHAVLWYLKPWIDFNLGINLEPFIFTAVEFHGIIITIIAGQVLAILAMYRIYNMNLIEEVARD